VKKIIPAGWRRPRVARRKPGVEEFLVIGFIAPYTCFKFCKYHFVNTILAVARCLTQSFPDVRTRSFQSEQTGRGVGISGIV
jgi:hypothetical protein